MGRKEWAGVKANAKVANDTGLAKKGENPAAMTRHFIASLALPIEAMLKARCGAPGVTCDAALEGRGLFGGTFMEGGAGKELACPGLWGPTVPLAFLVGMSAPRAAKWLAGDVNPLPSLFKVKLRKGAGQPLAAKTAVQPECDQAGRGLERAEDIPIRMLFPLAAMGAA